LSNASEREEEVLKRETRDYSSVANSSLESQERERKMYIKKGDSLYPFEKLPPPERNKPCEAFV
jgi:hypothetical protein